MLEGGARGPSAAPRLRGVSRPPASGGAATATVCGWPEVVGVEGRGRRSCLCGMLGSRPFKPRSGPRPVFFSSAPVWGPPSLHGKGSEGN